MTPTNATGISLMIIGMPTAAYQSSTPMHVKENMIRLNEYNALIEGTCFV